MERKKIIALLLACVMLVSLCGCGLLGPDLEPLYGTWTLVEYLDEDTALTMLESLDFYESEIALADLTSVGLVKYATFSEDGNYSLIYNEEESRQLMHNYFDQLITTLYEGRDALVLDYGNEIKDLTEEEFKQGYAELFGLSTYDELLAMYVENCFDYSVLQDASETGTFEGGHAQDEILCKVGGVGEEEVLRFSLENGELHLIYSDGEEVYTRK